MTLAEIEANLRFFENEWGIRELVFAGGELTDRPDLPLILDLVAKIPRSLERVTVVTRGHRWSDPNLLDRARQIPLTIVFSFDVWGPRDLDFSRPHSVVSRAIRSTRAIDSAGIRVTTNTVLSKCLLELAAPTAAALVGLPAVHHTLTFPFAKGGALSNEGAIVPQLEASRSALATFAQRFAQAERTWNLKGLPACYVPEHRGRINATKDRRYVTATSQFGGAEHYSTDRVNFVKQQQCSRCSAAGSCDGFWAHYLAAGWPALRPLP